MNRAMIDGKHFDLPGLKIHAYFGSPEMAHSVNSSSMCDCNWKEIWNKNVDEYERTRNESSADTDEL